MKKLLLIVLLMPLISCRQGTTHDQRVRQPVDSVGFATHARQMDSLMQRIDRQYAGLMDSLRQQAGINQSTTWRVAISPHDDYTYVGPLYPLVLEPVKAKTVILFGVAHKARNFGLENRMVFDSYPYWKTPYGRVKMTDLREQLISRLPANDYTVNDSMQAVEHSLEALLPFLQYYNHDVQFVPILVPYMRYGRMDTLAAHLSGAIAEVARENNLQWGRDFALVISTDAVHYGDEDWGGSNYAPYGADSAGYQMAVQHEHGIIDTCLNGPLDPAKIRQFSRYTVKDDNYKDYKWTWCGRYSVPMGLLTAYHLQQDLEAPPLEGVSPGYFNSIDHAAIPVKDLGMGTTAPARLHHWVGYAGEGYK